MSHLLPIDKAANRTETVRAAFGGLDLSKRAQANRLSSCMNVDTSSLPDLVGHTRWQVITGTASGAVLQLGVFHLGGKLYLVGFDGAHITLNAVDSDGYRLIHTFSESFSTEEVQNATLCVTFCSANYGGFTGRSILLYPWGYRISINENNELTTFSEMNSAVYALGFRHAVLHRNRIFSTDGYKIYASVPNSISDFSSYDEEKEDAAWVTMISDDVNAAVPVLGFVRFDGKLYYFCRNGFGQIRGEVNPFRAESVSEVGTVNMESVKILDKELYFLSDTGLMIYDGQKVRCVSDCLGIDRFSSGVGGVCKGQYYLGLAGANIGQIYTYCPENDSWGSILCYGNPIMFSRTDTDFYMLCLFSGRYSIYALNQTRNGWSAVSVPFQSEGLSQRHLRGVKMRMELHDGEKINCDLLVTRSDGSIETYALFTDVTGNTRMIVKKRLRDVWGVAFGFSIRATGGAVVSDFELIWGESEADI